MNKQLKVVAGERRTGKTTQLVQEAAKGFFHIVCANQQHAAYIWRIAEEKQLQIPYPITFREFLDRGFRGARIRGFLIDDVDSLLRELGGTADLVGFSYLSQEEVPCPEFVRKPEQRP